MSKKQGDAGKTSQVVDRYEYHDYYQVDELLTEEHKLIRGTEIGRASCRERV